MLTWLYSDAGYWTIYGILVLLWFSYILLGGRVSKKTRRLSNGLYLNNMVPKEDREYRHRFLPWKKYQVICVQPDTMHGPASVLVHKKGKYHWCSDIPLSIFNSRYKEVG